MLEFAVLGSGSSGNSALVRFGDTTLLIDAGLSARQLTTRLEKLGVDPDSLNAIVLTHEHGDHARGIDVFCRKRSIPIYATTHTAALVREGVTSPVTWRAFESGSSFTVGKVRFESFSVPHDAVDPVGFVIDGGGSRLGFLSDTGHVTRLILERLKGVDTLFTEANYDELLLQNDTKRPWATKQRISNRHGHLSNEQAAELVAAVVSERLQRVVLGHLSSDCNTAEIATRIISEKLVSQNRVDVPVECADRSEPLPFVPVNAAAPEPVVAMQDRDTPPPVSAQNRVAEPESPRWKRSQAPQPRRAPIIPDEPLTQTEWAF
ncbi:MAG: MBL fold metallo-hydrolase [Verrucomicrobiota bacterium]